MAAGRALVSVIIPAWNAQATLAETLATVACQSHAELDIVIVDDGSTDGTAAVAEQFCSRDPRARLLRQPHLGLAAARNRAIAEARGAYVAPLDADDLWHPDKIARQLARFDHGPPQVGLVYNWFRKVDGQGRVFESRFRPTIEGAVLETHLRSNFIGNGSTPLIRRDALDGVGYEPSLQANGNQGCEDYLLQLEVARRFQFACEPAFLTGYRVAGAAMSSDNARMIRSHIQIFAMLREELRGEPRRIARRQLARWRAVHALVLLKRRQLSAGAGEAARALQGGPGEALAASARLLLERIGLLEGAGCPGEGTGRHFRDFTADE